ncbi:MAG: hypothetical protein P4M08_12155 [Oligoflexia bacterium]|nr:hypothetical protein [Oligoflexia bacterium]
MAAKPDEHGVLKCPDGKEPTHLAGKCKGTWHAAKSKTGKPTNYCEFDWSSPISCASEGYADDAHADCYGPPYVIDTGANLLTEHDCAQKYPTPPNGAQYNLNCCAK